MDNRNIIIDVSWSGLGGIGRFTDEVSKLINGVSTKIIYAKCTSPFAPIGLSLNICLCRNVDLIFFPSYIPPLITFKKYVFTIHDLNHIDLPDNSSVLKKIFYRFIIKRGCRKANKIFTVSEFSKKRISDWSGVHPDKIITVYNGVSEVFNQDVKPYLPGFSYLLCVSNRKTHKNEHRIISSFAKADINKSIKLVFTGIPTDELLMLAKKNGLTDRVIFYGFISDHELPSLYKGALGLIFPSLYEGFGLPVVEAMACGVPVLTSTTSSLPEIAGDAAILVDPLSEDEISNGITSLVNDTGMREALIRKGIIRAKKFSWHNVVKKIEKTLAEECYGVK
ncbi:glycosyltransferase family 4 protein [Buttiauxella ferragutiae]|uniref:glycosyltransferase family 4 protein n=1 Tax=Buttiauxella ferragutiae TaxID=82989 RepID=UPI003524A36D